MKVLFQVINIARCYPPQLKDGEYPRRDFTEAPEESTSAAPSPLRTLARKRQAVETDVVEDSEDLGDTHFSSGDDDGAVIPAKPLDSRLPLQAGKKILSKFSLDAS
jgi:hypothetical protein